MKKIVISTKLRCSFDLAVAAAKQSSLLHYVSWPLVIFSPVKDKFPDQWQKGTYWTKLSLFGLVPFPKQAIVISCTATETDFCLRDNGHSALIKKWDHLIDIRRLSDKEVLYQDTVEIDAGIVTPLVWSFAWGFYAYRQHRWRKLVKHNFESLEIYKSL